MATSSLTTRVLRCAAIVVCVFVVPSVGFATKKPPPQPININAATSEELQLVPGIGPATAEKILTMRKSYGVFKSVDDLLAIRGIGKKRLDKMRKYLIAGHPTAASKPGATSKPARSPAAASCLGCAKAAPQNDARTL